MDEKIQIECIEKEDFKDLEDSVNIFITNSKYHIIDVKFSTIGYYDSDRCCDETNYCAMIIYKHMYKKMPSGLENYE